MTEKTTTSISRPARPAASRDRSHRRKPAPATQLNATGNSNAQQLTANQNYYVGLNHLASSYLAGHRGRTLGETSVLDLIAWAQDYCQMRPKTMSAGSSR